LTISFDGFPPDLQSLCSKICSRSQNSWTNIPKTHFSIYRQLKFGPRAHKIGARMLKNVFSNQSLRRPNTPIRGPKIVEAKVLLMVLIRRPNTPIRGPIFVANKFQSLGFFVASAPDCLINYPKIYIKSVRKTRNDRVSSTIITLNYINFWMYENSLGQTMITLNFATIL